MLAKRFEVMHLRVNRGDGEENAEFRQNVEQAVGWRTHGVKVTYAPPTRRESKALEDYCKAAQLPFWVYDADIETDDCVEKLNSMKMEAFDQEMSSLRDEILDDYL